MKTPEWAASQLGMRVRLKNGTDATVVRVTKTKNGRGAWLTLDNGTRVYRENPAVAGGAKRS